MISQTSPGACVFLLFFVVAAIARGQTSETVVASVNGVPITQQQVDESIAARIYLLQQQFYARRRAPLEILVAWRLLEAAAKAGVVSVDELLKQLTHRAISITRA